MPDAPIARALAGHWSSLALRGVCALVFGILSFIWPALSLTTLVLIWGVYALLDGGVALVAGVRAKIWSLAFIGLMGVLAGIYAFVNPAMTALVLLYFIAAWAIITGLLAIYIAIHLRKELTGEWVLALAGVLSVLFGVLLLARPGAGALTVVFLIASYAVAFGVLMLMLAFKLRGLPERVASAR
jgi:uncharacterized membrane protein HdeD (DUF308 family)